MNILNLNNLQETHNSAVKEAYKVDSIKKFEDYLLNSMQPIDGFENEFYVEIPSNETGSSPYILDIIARD